MGTNFWQDKWLHDQYNGTAEKEREREEEAKGRIEESAPKRPLDPSEQSKPISSK
jgi:hypothetical protein